LLITLLNIGVGFEAVEFAGLDQRSDDDPVFTAARWDRRRAISYLFKCPGMTQRGSVVRRMVPPRGDRPPTAAKSDDTGRPGIELRDIRPLRVAFFPNHAIIIIA
jgi:hypothetical protein